MQINESIQDFIIKELNKIKNIKKKIIGVLGLAFKPENDDIRDSLSIKLLKLLKKNKFKTLQSDEYFQDKRNVSKEYLLKKSHVIIIGAPHKSYNKISYPKKTKLINVWGD